MPTALINGINLYYEVHGRGKPLIMIQGLGGGHQAWAFQVAFFQRHLRVITFDNRGIGKSGISPEPYTIRVMADDTIGLMDHLGIERAHILGLSLGGMVAQEIAISYPKRVDKIILCSTFASRETNDITHDAIGEVSTNGDPAEAGSMRMDSGKFLGSFISLSFNKWPYRLFFNLVSKFGMKSTVKQGYLAQIGAVRGHETKSRLHRIQAPTLVITGAADRLVPPHLSESIAKLIPNARLVKVDGGSHAFFFEMAKRFNKEVLNFLNE